MRIGCIIILFSRDGALADKQTLYWLHNPGNDDTSNIHSIAFDTAGNLYVATTLGVQVCDQNGRVRAILSLPEGKRNCLMVGWVKIAIFYLYPAMAKFISES